MKMSRKSIVAREDNNFKIMPQLFRFLMLKARYLVIFSIKGELYKFGTSFVQSKLGINFSCPFSFGR